MKRGIPSLVAFALVASACGDDSEAIDPPKPGDVAWSLTLGSPEDDFISSLSASPTDQLLIAGSFGGPLTLGAAQLSAAGEQDAFVALLDVNGAPLWSLALGATEFSRISAATLGPDGSVYICGSFRGTLTLGTQEVVSDGGNDLFAAKLNSAGSPAWVTAFGTDGAQSAQGIAVDPAGGVTLLGRAVAEELAFVDGALSGTGESAEGQLLLLKLDAAGSFVWGRTFGEAEGVPRPAGLAVSNTGKTLVAGTLDGAWQIAGQTLDGQSQGFTASFDSQGEPEWAQLSTTPGAGKVSYNAVLPTVAGPTYVGSLRGNSSVGVTALNDLGAGDIVVSQMSPLGAPAWAKSFGGIGNESARAITASTTGELYVSGIYQGEPAYAETPLPNSERHGTVVLKLSPEGELIWASGVVTHSPNAGRAVAVLSDGTAVVAGGFVGDMQAGSEVFRSQGGQDAYLLKLRP